MALLLLPGLWLFRRLQRGRVVAAVLLAAALIPFAGCSNAGTSATTYVVTVEATSGALVHSVQIAVKVPAAQ